MLFCKNCGSVTEKGSRYCEKCFADLRADGAVIDNIGIASASAERIIETGIFSADAVMTEYNLCGCYVGNILLTEKIGSSFGNDFYKGIDNKQQKNCLVKHLIISENKLSDRYSLISGKKPENIISQAEKICQSEFDSYKENAKRQGLNFRCFRWNIFIQMITAAAIFSLFIQI